MTALAPRLAAAVAVRRPWQRLAYRAGTLLIVLGLAHVVPLAADGFAWSGAVSWRKPIVFGVSLGLAAWSAGWVLGHLPARRRVGWSVTGVIVVSSLLEWALITLQRWRGVASHFNTATAFDGMIFSAMGVSVGILTLGYLGLLVWAAVELRQPVAVRWAAVTGLALLLVASGLGGDLIARGTAEVARTGVVPDAVQIGVAGTGKLAHGVGLHGIQVLGAIAILLGLTGLSGPAAGRIMRAASLAYAAGFGAVVAQVYSGRPLADVGSPWVVVAVASAAVVTWSGLRALRMAVAASTRATDGATPPVPTSMA